jgi:Trp operon repressor
MASILKRNHLELRPSGLQGDQKKHPLGIERGIHISTFTRGSNAIKHAEGGVIEITLGSHRSQTAVT